MIFSKPSPCPILTRCSLRLLSIQAWQKVEAKLIRTMASHVSNLFQRTRKTRPAGELISIGLIYVIFDFYISHTVSFCFLQVVVLKWRFCSTVDANILCQERPWQDECSEEHCLPQVPGPYNMGSVIYISFIHACIISTPRCFVTGHILSMRGGDDSHLRLSLEINHSWIS